MYQTQNGLTKISVRMDGEIIWLTQAQMVEPRFRIRVRKL